MKLKQLTTEVLEGHRPPQSMLSLLESSTSTRAACTVLPALMVSMNNYFDQLKTLICSSDDLVSTCEVHAYVPSLCSTFAASRGRPMILQE